MNGNVNRAHSARHYSRALILSGTALGAVLISTAASAQNVTHSGPGDYTLSNPGTISGGPRTIDVTTASGNISIDVGTVLTTNSGTALGAGIAANNTGPGNIAVTPGTVTASGTGQTYGVDARAATGNIAIRTGTVTSNSNPNSRGIYAISGGGNITINAGETDGGQRGIFTGTNNGIFPNVTTIVSNIATANGTNSPNAIVGQGQTVDITSGTARDTNTAGVSGTAIFANAGTGGAIVRSGLAEALGNNQSAIQIYSDSTVLLVSGTARTTQSSDGLSVQSGTDVSIRSGTVTTTGANGARGIVVNTPSAPVNITSGSVSTAGTNSSAMLITGTTGAVTINSGTINTSGANSIGISLASQKGATGITSDTIGTAGASARGISVTSTGPVSITSHSIATTGANAFGIFAQSTTGDIALNSGDVKTSGLGSQGLWAQTTSGNIVISAGNTVTTATGYNAGTGATQDAVFGYSSGAGSVTVTSQNASTAGDYSSAVGAVGGSAVNITSGTASSSGFQLATVYGLSRNSDVTINATNSTATGVNAYAVEGHAANGNLTINSTTALAEHGNAVYGTAGALANVTAGTATARGDGGTGVAVTGGSVALNVGSASSNGTTVTNQQTGVTYRADAIFAQATAGAINAVIGSASATGAGSDAVHLLANGTGGAVTAQINGNVSSASGTGLWIDPPGAVVINVAPGATVSGATGIMTVGATNAITNFGTITGTAGAGIVATGATTLVNGGSVAGANNLAVQLGAANDSVTLLTGSTVSGRIVGGGGTDAAVLSGAGTGAVAGFDGFDSLTVKSGYWTGNPVNASTFNAVTISPSATLEVVNGATGISGVTAPTFTDNGTLVVRSSAASAGSTFGTTTVAGSGNVALTGSGTVTLDGINTIATIGGITVDGGSRLLVTGTQGGTIVTGTGGTLLVGNGGTTGAVTGSVIDNGTLIVNRSDDYLFAAGLTGSGSLFKQGAGKLIFGSNYAFTGETTIQQGSIKLSAAFAPTTELDLEGNGQLDLSGTRQTVAELQGSSPGASINIDAGSLTVNQLTNTLFAGSIVGNGTLTKTGTGTLNLTGISTYTGPTTVSGGILAVNGSITSPVAVTSGGTLGGTGSVGSVTIGSGGTYAPGNSIGTQTVNGNVTFAAGSVYAVEANAAGQSDRINATGTATIAGGTVKVLAAPGVYAPLTNYTILTATGGVTGRFANATSNMAFLTPYLSYGANNVLLTLGRNDISFASQATGSNQLAVANAVNALGLGNPVYNAVLVQTSAGAQSAFQQLSGEIQPAVSTVLIDGTRRVRDAILNHGAVDGQGMGIWADGLRTYAQARSQNDFARIKTERTGLIGGVDFGLGAFRAGVNGGYSNDHVQLLDRASTAKVKTTSAGASLAWAPAPTGYSLQVGGTYAWHDVDTVRAVGVAGIAGTSTSRYHAHTSQVFGEGGYTAEYGALRFNPFVRYAHVWTDVDGAVETGGAAALAVASQSLSTNFATAGLRMSGSSPLSPNVSLQPHANFDYTHAWDDRAGIVAASFIGANSPFGVSAARIGRDTLGADIGLEVVSGNLRFGLAGVGSVSSEWNDYGAKASVAFRF